MKDNISKARECLKKIKYYYDYAGANGYSQAMFYFSELGRRYRDGAKNDQQIIQSYYKEAKEFMDEMKKWQDNFRKENP